LIAGSDDKNGKAAASKMNFGVSTPRTAMFTAHGCHRIHAQVQGGCWAGPVVITRIALHRPVTRS